MNTQTDLPHEGDNKVVDVVDCRDCKFCKTYMGRYCQLRACGYVNTWQQQFATCPLKTQYILIKLKESNDEK